MKTLGKDFLGIELKQHYFEEFKVYGIPVPGYSNTTGFILQFKSLKHYLNYLNVLKLILCDLESADPDKLNYEIQRSQEFIKNLIKILHHHYTKKYN